MSTLPLTEQLSFLYEAKAASSVLEASRELGILERLGPVPIDARQLADACHIRDEVAGALLTALVSLGLAERAGHGGYRGVGYEVTEFLELLRPWEDLAEGLRHRPEPRAEDGFARTVGPLARVYAGAAEQAARHLSGRRVLDLGAGAAPWSLALAVGDPDCLITAVDLPHVIETTRQAVAAAGCEEQFRFVGADVFDVGLEEGGFDLVIAGHFCHLFDETANRRLLGRVARWLAPGGTVAVIDILSNERGEGPRGVMLYALGLVRRRPAGRLYPFSSYAGWLRATGFEKVERADLGACPPATLVRARRP